MFNDSILFWPFMDGLLDWYEKKQKALTDGITNVVDFTHPDNIGFVDKGEDGYEMCLELNSKATKDNVSIDIQDGEMLVKYSYSDGTTSTRNEIEMTLPEDLDVKTMNAKVSNGVLAISAKKIVKAEPAKVEDDDFEVTINLN